MIPAYSPIEHLAKTLCPNDLWGKTRLAMFTACFDTAGTEHDQPMIMTAGFISSANDWIAFDLQWRERLAVDGIAYFHMVEFAQSKKQFKGWRDQEPRRRALLGDLLEIISKHAYRKFGCGISMPKWESMMSKKTLDDFRINAYSMAGMLCVALVDNWAHQEQIGNAVEIVFENGDVGKGKLQASLSPRAPEPIFRAKKDDTEKKIVAFTPLQAADLLAYELFVGVRNYESNTRRGKPRFGLEHFHKMPGVIKYLDPKDFKDLDGMFTSIADAIGRGQIP
jgi:hypothetical protein